MPSLVLIKAPGGQTAGTTFVLGDAATVIGREADTCQIYLNNTAVSRRHAQVTWSQGKYFLEDLKSRNHTFLNNQDVTAPTALKNDDRIKVCDYLFRFHDETAAPTAPHVPLPGSFRRQTADDDETDAMPHVESTVAVRSSAQLLDAQPSDRLRALLDISASLSRTLELEPLLPKIADTLFGVFRQADRCFIILLDDAGRPYPKVVKARRSAGGDDQRFSKTIVRRCLESMQSYLSEDASSDLNLGAAQSITDFRIRSVMCVPLATADGKPLGALQLDTQDRGKKFREDDLKLLTIVANLASVSIENASLHEDLISREAQEREIEIAKQVQLGFLPQAVPAVAGYEFYHFYSAAQSVGGDYYDFIPLPDGRLAVVLGDVAGKGVPASLLMAKLSAEARYCFLTRPDPAEAVARLNDQLINGGIGDRYVTFAAAVFAPADHAVTLVNAGHLAPMLYRRAGGVYEEAIGKDESGCPLGWIPGNVYRAVSRTFDPGDALVLYTDGVTDATSPAGDLFQFDGIRKAVTDPPPRATPRELGDRVVRAVRRHSNGQPQSDDIAVVCFGRLADSTGSHPDLSGPKTARIART